MKSYSLLNDYYCMPRRLGCPIFVCIEKIATFQAHFAIFPNVNNLMNIISNAIILLFVLSWLVEAPLVFSTA